MGLDIVAHRKITKVSGKLFDRDGYPVDPDGNGVEYSLRAYVNPDFPGRNGSVEDGAYYESGQSVSFRAGSYGGYNSWRNQLAKVAGYPETPYERYGKTSLRHDAGAWAANSGPFWELINFSDCEGVIGPEVSAKLAADFAAHDEAAKSVDDPWFYGLYQKWREAFEMASDGGAVSFH